MYTNGKGLSLKSVDKLPQELTTERGGQARHHHGHEDLLAGHGGLGDGLKEEAQILRLRTKSTDLVKKRPQPR